MSNRGATSAAAVAAGLLAVCGSALADIKQECSDAYYTTQVLRDAGQLEEGIEMAQMCMRDGCAKFIREDCAQWRAELEGRISSILVEVLDPSGAPVTAGRASLDGAPWLDHLGGPARVVSKGTHTLEITVKGTAPQTRTIVVREGEKNRKITIALTAEAAPPEERSIGPWILGGAGVALLLGGAVTGGLTVAAYSEAQDDCSDETRTCETQEGVDAQERGLVLGPVTTVLLAGGAALVASGAVWLLAVPGDAGPAAASLFVAPAVSSHEAGVVLGGTW